VRHRRGRSGRRRPLGLWRSPRTFVALALGSFLLAVAAAAYPMFMSSTANRLLQQTIDEPTTTRYGNGIRFQTYAVPLRPQTYEGPGSTFPYRRFGNLFTRLADRSPDLGPSVRSVLGPTVGVRTSGPGSPSIPGQVFAASDALEHVRVIEGHQGHGVWLTNEVARTLHLRPGQTIVLAGQSDRSVRVQVDGVYRELNRELLPGYWRLWSQYIRPGPEGAVPPPLILVDPGRILRLSHKLGGTHALFGWQAPIARGIELEDARRAATYLDGMTDRLMEAGPLGFASIDGSYLPSAVRKVDDHVAMIEGPARLLEGAGVVVALVVAAAGAAFVLGRRRTELQLMIARGTGPATLAARLSIESAAPFLTGAFAGWGFTYVLVWAAGPGGRVGPTAIRAASAGTVVAALVSLFLFALVGVVTYVRESAGGRVLGPLRAWVPWEIVLLILAYVAWRRLAGAAAPSHTPGAPMHGPNLLLVAFPLLLIGGFAVTGARAVRGVALFLRQRSARYSGPWYLTIHRLAAGSSLALLLVAVSTLCLGVFVQAATVARSVQTTVDAKAKIFVGSDVEARIDYRNVIPQRFPFPMTRVIRVSAAGTLSTGGAFDLLAVDPDTVGKAAYWNDGLADVSIDELSRRLATPSRGALPVIIAGRAPERITSIEVDQKAMPVRVVEAVSAFPGMLSLRPLVVVAERSFLGAFDGYSNPLDTPHASTQLWIRGDEAAIRRALPQLGFTPDLVFTASEVKDIPYITAVIDTFVVLNVLGLVAALLLIGGMLMYLQARERSNAVSYGLSLRMGMTHSSHRRAIVSELGSMLGSSFLMALVLAGTAALVVVPKLDPLPVIPPAPFFVSPWNVMGWAMVAIAFATSVGGWLTNRQARRIDLGEVMRLAE
jgi:putative ABC transport system permease protein